MYANDASPSVAVFAPSSSSGVASYSSSAARIARVLTPGTLSVAPASTYDENETDAPGAFNYDDLKAATEGLDKDPQFRLAQTVLSR